MTKDYILYYDPIRAEGSDKDIQKHGFNTHAQMIDFIDEKTYMRRNQCVWVVSKDDLEDVFVSKNALSIQDFLEKKSLWKTKGVFHLFECESLHEAYDLAKNITETYHENK